MEPERRCAVTGDRDSRDGMVRFVVTPDGGVVPDLAERLPGRGVWIGSQRDLVREGVRKNVFARHTRRTDARPEKDLECHVERALARRLREVLSLTNRSGNIVVGFERTRARLLRGAVGVLLSAFDGAEEGRRKLRSLQPEAPVLDCLDSTELGAAFGRERLIHGAVEPGRLARMILREASRLEGFRSISTVHARKGVGDCHGRANMVL